MQATQLRRAREIVDSVRAAPSEARERMIIALSGGDSVLLNMVRGVLDGYRDEPASPTSEAPATTGTIIGGYTIMERLGEGGFGVVYLAEQQQPIRRRVAIKVIKPGMDSHATIARFQVEREALALMDHPGIARVLDAGLTHMDRPYFVMEHVAGTSVTAYCEGEALKLPARLELMIRICEAVQHAHTKGIIHRDLKPSNILIAQQDGRPQPKIIDFGVAKAIGAGLSERTVMTGQGQLLGTPEYMSPEQASLGAADVDTRADIYSLGVLCYELVTGVLPFDRERLLQGGLTGIQRTIREIEPPTPSTRLASLGPADLSRLGGVDPRSFSRTVRGELDWIVMKAMEKDRERRYQSAAELGRDLGRYLKGGPVLAGPPSRIYRMKALARRHRAAVAIACIAAASVVLLITGLTYAYAVVSAQRDAARALQTAEREQRLAAERNEQRAKREAEKSAAVKGFLQEILAAASPAVAKGNTQITVREALDAAAARIDGGALKSQPDVEGAVRHTLGTTYAELGELVPATAQLRAAIELRTSLHGERSEEVHESTTELGVLFTHQGKLDEAEGLLRRALEIAKSVWGPSHQGVGSSMANLGLVMAERGDAAAAEPVLRDAMAMMETCGNKSHAIAAVKVNLGGLMRMGGKLDQAELLLREAVSMLRTEYGGVHPDVRAALAQLVIVLRKQGKLDEALTVQRETLEIAKRLYGEEHTAVAASLNGIAMIREMQGNLDEAESLYRESLALERKLFGHDHKDVAAALHNLSDLLQRRGRLAEAIDLEREALAIARAIYPDGHPNTITLMSTLARMLLDAGNVGEAEPLVSELLETTRRLQGPDHPHLLPHLNAMGELRLAQRQWESAAAHFREALELARRIYGDVHFEVAAALSNLGTAHKRQGKLDEAHATYLQALAILRELPGDQSEAIGVLFANLGSIAWDLGEMPKAEAHFRQALKLERQRSPDSPSELGRSLYDLARSVQAQGRAAEAEPDARAALEIQRGALPAVHPAIANSLALLGACLKDQGRLTEAAAALSEALSLTLSAEVATGQSRIERTANLAEVLIDLGKFDEAQSLLLSAWASIVADPTGPKTDRQRVAGMLVALYEKWPNAQEAERWQAQLKAAADSSP